jgi:hypothetical protein
VEVMRREAHPLRPISSTDASCRRATLVADCRWRDSRLMPTPRATWLVEPLSVEPDLSRLLSFSQAPPLRVRCRSAASCAVHRLSPTYGGRHLREPSPHSVIRVRHHRALAKRVPSCRARALACPRIRGELALTPTSPRLAHPFATSPLRIESPLSDPPINPVFGLVRDASTSRESFRC